MRRPDGGASSGRTSGRTSCSPIVSNVGIPAGRSARLHREHRPARRAGAGLPGHAGQAEAQRRARSWTRSARSSPGSSRARRYLLRPGGIVSRVLNFGARRRRSRSRCSATTSPTRRRWRARSRGSCATSPGVADVQVSREGTIPQFEVVVDREKAATAGLSQRDVAQAALFSLNSNVEREPVGVHRPADGQPVQHRRAARRAVPACGRRTSGGSSSPRDGGRPVVLLSTIAEHPARAWPRWRSSGSTSSGSIRVSGNAVGRDLGSVSDDIEAALRRAPAARRLHGPAGRADGAAAGGVREPLLHVDPRDHARLHGDGVAVPVAEGSLHHHVLGAHGAHRRAFWALYLTRTTLSTTSFMGIIMMVGIVVSNGVLLVEYINELRRRGMPLARGGAARRPDAAAPDPHDELTTVVGLMPMALGSAGGRRGEPPAGPRGHRRPDRLDRAHAGPDPHPLHDPRGALPADTSPPRRQGAA